MRRKKRKLLMVFGIAAGLFAIRQIKREFRMPDMVVAINSLNHEYCTIIAYKRSVSNKVELAMELIEMCKENGFETLSFATDVRGYPRELSMNVYLTEEDFHNGKLYMQIEYLQREYKENCNIKEHPENYQLNIDGELIDT